MNNKFLIYQMIYQIFYARLVLVTQETVRNELSKTLFDCVVEYTH
jgi:hypothetical protein